MEDMRLTLTEQEETQRQMEEVLEDKLHLIQELSDGNVCVVHYVEFTSGLSHVELGLIHSKVQRKTER